MTVPRNRTLYEQGQTALRQVREVMHSFKPGAQCTWKHVNDQLTPRLAKTQVCKYMRVVRQEDRAHRHTAPSALQISVNQTHPDAYATKHRSKSLTARLFDGRGRGLTRAVEKHPLQADRGGQIPNRGPRPAPLDTSRRTGQAPVVDKLASFRDPDVRDRDPIFERDFS
jgi:hypothetical protein